MKQDISNNITSTEKKSVKPTFTEGIDYYFENGLMVLTEHFLKNRGYCCGNNCRHCPYEKNSTEKS